MVKNGKNDIAKAGHVYCRTSRSSLVSRLHLQLLCGIEKFFDGLKSAGAGFSAGVPDLLQKGLCAYVTDICVVKNATPPLLLHQWAQTLCPFGSR